MKNMELLQNGQPMWQPLPLSNQPIRTLMSLPLGQQLNPSKTQGADGAQDDQYQLANENYILQVFLFWVGFINSIMAQHINRAPAANPGPTSNFSGSVMVTMLVAANPETDCLVSSVTFEPKARTFYLRRRSARLTASKMGCFYEGFHSKSRQVQGIPIGAHFPKHIL